MSAVTAMRGAAAVRSLNKKAEGLLEPLLDSDDDSDASSDSEDTSTASSAPAAKRTAMERLKEGAVYVGLSVGAAASAAAMAFYPAVAVFVMGGICAANVPYAAYKERGIARLPALRTLNNLLREDANRLEDEVDALSAEIDELAPEADRASEVEEELRQIAEVQNTNVDKLVDLVKENQEIIEELQDNLRRKIAQDVMSVVMKCDTDNNGMFSKIEIKMLVVRVKYQLQEYGVEFDEAKFLKIMSRRPSVRQTIKIVSGMIPNLDEDDDDDDDEFDDDLDMFYVKANADEMGCVAGGSLRHMSGGSLRRMSGGSQRRMSGLGRRMSSGRAKSSAVRTTCNF